MVGFKFRVRGNELEPLLLLSFGRFLSRRRDKILLRSILLTFFIYFCTIVGVRVHDSDPILTRFWSRFWRDSSRESDQNRVASLTTPTLTAIQGAIHLPGTGTFRMSFCVCIYVLSVTYVF